MIWQMSISMTDDYIDAYTIFFEKWEEPIFIPHMSDHNRMRLHSALSADVYANICS